MLIPIPADAYPWPVLFAFFFIGPERAYSMAISSQLDRIRRHVEEAFRQLGSPCPKAFREIILVNDGHYCGRRFVCEDLEAVWFIEEAEVKFYGPDGTVLQVATFGMRGTQSLGAA